MDKEISEFTDTYSDNILFLSYVRQALLRHPLKITIHRYWTQLSHVYTPSC